LSSWILPIALSYAVFNTPLLEIFDARVLENHQSVARGISWIGLQCKFYFC
jgi:hypothetical protein